MARAGRRRRVLWTAVVVASVVTLALLPTNHTTVVGGRAVPLGLPTTEDDRGTEHGTWLITSALIRRETVAERLWIRLGPGRERPAAPLALGAALQSMAVTKDTAWTTALDLLAPLLVVDHVIADTPAAQAGLAAGDVVVEIDQRAPRASDVDRLLALGQPLPVRVLRAGRVVDVTLAPAAQYPQPPGGGAAMRPLDTRPQPPVIDTFDIQGDSAGVLLVVAYVDLLTAGDLTAGETVAVTGGIAPGGQVLSVLAYGTKAHAAARAGAQLFVVPAVDVDLVRSVAPAGLVISGAASSRELLGLLCRRGGTSRACASVNRA